MKILERYSLFDSVLPTSTGIYRIYNLVSGKQYIGSARAQGKSPSQKGFRIRFDNTFRGHRAMLLGNNHHCQHLQRSYNRVIESGVDPNEVFEIQILEYVEPEFCLSREQWYLDNCGNKYNCSTIASGSNSTKGRKQSPEVTARKKAEKRIKDIEKSGAYLIINSRTGQLTEVGNLYLFCEQKGYSERDRKSIEKDIARGREYGSFLYFRFYPWDCHISATIRAMGRDRVRMFNGTLDLFSDKPDFWAVQPPEGYFAQYSSD